MQEEYVSFYLVDKERCNYCGGPRRRAMEKGAICYQCWMEEQKKVSAQEGWERIRKFVLERPINPFTPKATASIAAVLLDAEMGLEDE
jgi:hypothetical protein